MKVAFRHCLLHDSTFSRVCDPESEQAPADILMLRQAIRKPRKFFVEPAFERSLSENCKSDRRRPAGVPVPRHVWYPR